FGNRVLQLYARKVFDTTGNSGTCYRIDGTKFAVISNSLSWEEIQERYNDFRNYFREVFQIDDKRILLEVNGGAIRLDQFEYDSQTVYACLNFAYVESKSRRQGDLVLFHNDLNDENKLRIEKLHAIRASITHGYKGFYLLYQPVVDAKTEQLIGAEALLRWKNDTYGMVPPDQFIPLLESDPLFPELGEWIIREAVYAAKKIIKKNPEFVVNINLSYTQLEKPDFVDMVFNVLDDLKYPAEHICFEVTERCRLLDIQLLRNVIISLKARGVLVALDDFGTGFSSIGIVKELPFDIIKIDRGFVTKIEEDEVERELIKYFAGFASLFGAKVCVEGIETEGMRNILQKYHVESFQGYYYAKPLMLDEILKWSSNAES
ncbi:MAG: EAL domain-containing protein, partial [Clostridiales bacterium]|nr:EAL domain-containing protein [Clostridiales bacterium]